MIQSSGGKRKQSDKSENVAVSVYCRFEIKPENIKNEWYLPSQLVLYLNKYISTDLS